MRCATVSKATDFICYNFSEIGGIKTENKMSVLSLVKSAFNEVKSQNAVVGITYSGVCSASVPELPVEITVGSIDDDVNITVKRVEEVIS